METNAIKLENGNMGCPECKSEEFSLTMHMDHKDSFQNSYVCTKCGAGVWVEHKRSKEDAMYWE